MSNSANAGSDALEGFSRRSLWIALAIVLLLASFAGATLAGSGAAAWAVSLMPIAIAIGIVVVGKRPGSTRELAALQRDELRRHSMALAQRDALISVLAAQPVSAYVLALTGAPAPTALMACGTVTLGAVVLLMSLLLRDR